MWAPDLAPPWAVINKYKQSGNRAVFKQEYLEYLSTVPKKMLPTCDVVLVCYEKDPMQCHRSILAEWLGFPDSEWR